MTHQLYPVARWAKVTTFVLSLVGLAISAYLTVTHFAPHALACVSNSTFNCEDVTTSPQSYLLGIPVAFLGLGQYLVMSVLNSPWGWRAHNYWVHVARMVLGAVGMAFVLWLVSAELLIINHICPWCTGVHLVTFALLMVLLSVVPGQLGWGRTGEEPEHP